MKGVIEVIFASDCFSLFYPLSLYCEKMAKNGHVHEGGKVGRSNATPTIFFSVDSYDLQSLSFKFGNDTFLLFTFYFWNAKGILQKARWQNEHFIASVIRSLA